MYERQRNIKSQKAEGDKIIDTSRETQRQRGRKTDNIK